MFGSNNPETEFSEISDFSDNRIFEMLDLVQTPTPQIIQHIKPPSPQKQLPSEQNLTKFKNQYKFDSDIDNSDEDK